MLDMFIILIVVIDLYVDICQILSNQTLKICAVYSMSIILQ